MSLVGTRPPTVDEYEQYELGHRKRLAMKPGLTGMWQVSGRSDITDFDEVVALDAKYIEQWDITMDIKILCQRILHPARIRVFHRAVPAVEWTGGNPPFPDVRSGRG